MYFVRDCVFDLCPDLWCGLIVSEVLVIVMCDLLGGDNWLHVSFI